MSQTTITSFFNSRKRAANDDIVSSKNKIAHLEVLNKTPQHPVITNNIKVGLESIELLKNGDKNTKSEPAEPSKPVSKSGLAKKGNAININRNEDEKKQNSTRLARNDLSLGDIRKKLAGSSRLAELKAKADKLSSGIQQLKANTEKKNLKQFKSINVEVPISPSKKEHIQKALQSPVKNESKPSTERLLMSPRKVVVSPIKSPTKVPAYIRHAALATTTSLPLPHQYRFLAELFRGMETVVSLLFNRNEKITFNKLKPSIQEMLKRNFTEKHLAQIKLLVPDFYSFEVQKCKNSSQKEGYELIVTPNFPNDIKLMNPSILLERRRYFYDTLMQLVKKHHSQFLLTLDPPMVIADNKLTRWHPEFELEKVPEVEMAKLPELPNACKYSSAQDVLSKARELFKCNTKMERALENLAKASARGLTDEEKAVTGLGNTTSTQTPSASNVTLLNPALRNLPTSLLEKVKAKQAAKALEAMTRSTDVEQKYLVYTRLPDLARTLRNIYVTERKNVLALNIVLSKLNSSFKAHVSANQLEKDIKMLTEISPEWIKLHDIRNTSYLKLDKNVDLQKIVSKLDDLAAKYKCD